MRSCIMNSFSITLSKFIWYYSMYQNSIPFGLHWWSSGSDCLSTAGDTGSTPARRIKMSHALRHGQIKKEFPSFLWLNNILLCVYTTYCQLIHPLMNIWVIFMFGLLWAMLLYTFMYKILYGHIFSLHLDIQLGI